jgi:Alr-MurF fusion protein
MQYNTATLSQIFQGAPLGAGADVQIRQLVYDSRRVTDAEYALFFALGAGRNNGHYYLAEAYRQGVRAFVVSDKTMAIKVLPHHNCTIWCVTDTLVALQSLATAHRAQFVDLPTIGITGSNGKTIVKEWLFQLLKPEYDIVRSPKSYNSQLGVPLSVWQINDYHTLGIFEAGISQMDEMANLAKIIQPDTVIFTNLGHAHDAGFTNMLAKAEEKLLLCANAKTIIYSKNYTLIDDLIQRKYADKTTFTLSTKPNIAADLVLQSIEKQDNFTRLTAKYKDETFTINLPFGDAANIENAMLCCAALLCKGYDATTIAARMLGLQAIELRLELKDGINGCTIINDSYSLDTNSLKIALDFAVQQKTNTRTSLVLSDLLETGKKAAVLYREVAQLLAHYALDTVIMIGQDGEILRNYLQAQNYATYPTTTAFLAALDAADVAFAAQTILLKGARVFEFERIALRLSQKQHKTTLEINLNALEHNLAMFRSYILPTTKLMVMVKAAAYGSGSYQIAKLLEHKKVDYLAVAYTDEGYDLRQANITLPIMVMNVQTADFEAIIKYKLEPEIYTLQLLRDFLRAVQTATAPTLPYPIHLKLDTGMRRLGFEQDADFAQLLEVLHTAQSTLQVASIMTHLVASDNAAHDGFTAQQKATFDAMAAQIMAKISHQPLLHLLNSSGIHRFSQYQGDMVRLGIGLYGIDANPAVQAQLQTVMTLKATISQLKYLKAGETIGYNRVGQAQKDTVSATISIGYADGFSRRLGNGKGGAYIRGQFAPVIGNVCMDMTMLDVTHIADIQAGDEVEIFGQFLPVQTLAQAADTIAYEIFTAVSSRVKRVYVQE